MRLTKKQKNRLASHGFRECDYLLNGTSKIEALNKLGEIEDIEDIAGIEAKFFVKAVLDGVYVSEDGVKHRAFFCQKSLYVEFKKRHFYYHRKLLKDFCITWSLNKNDLRKEVK